MSTGKSEYYLLAKIGLSPSIVVSMLLSLTQKAYTVCLDTNFFGRKLS